MKALTIRQPWASLIAAGVKTIETRSWSTEYRGPLAIHAGKAKPERSEEGCGVPVGHDWLPVEDFDGSWRLEHFARGCTGAPYDIDMPLGAVVATCTLADVVPIGGPYSFRTGIAEGDEGDFPDSRVVVRQPAVGWAPESLVIDRPHEDITDQLPFGDFTPGRWAWLLTDITPCDPVLAKGRLGMWDWEADR